MAEPISLNAARKRRAGLADTGCCPRCGLMRFVCNLYGECQPAESEAEARPFPNGRPSDYTRNVVALERLLRERDDAR